MKVRALLTVCFVILLAKSPFAVAQDNRFDITLEGPWIFYVDHSLAPWPVLIAIAPNTHSAPYWRHDPIIVSSGDGFVLGDYNSDHDQQVGNIYCLLYGTDCGPKGATTLKFEDYYGGPPLQMKHPSGQASWDWITVAHQANATALILQMPDSYSDDGAWPMRFAPKYDGTVNVYGQPELHSIGVQLHYTAGPDDFDLALCTSGNIKKCMTPISGVPTIKGHTHLNNSGTLRIVMKAPPTETVCDPHVRRIFPKMMDIVGWADNKNKSVIDPAHKVKDNGDGAFDEDFPGEGVTEPDGVTPYSCLRRDGQNPACDTSNPPCDSDLLSKPPVQTYGPWLEALTHLKAKIEKLPPDQKKPYLQTIVSENLAYPSLSQLATIQVLIKTAYDKLGAGNQDEASSLPSAKKMGKDEPVATLPEVFKILKFLNTPPTKSGADCKAAVMLVK
jgi:hypothetical protein